MKNFIRGIASNVHGEFHPLRCAQTAMTSEVSALSPIPENELHSRRSALIIQRRFVEAIPIQLQILASAQQTSCVREISNVWNMLSHLFQQNEQLAEAEEAARQAIATYAQEAHPRLETLATYEMKLATILAGQRRYEESIHFGELAIEHFSDYHDPQNDFLRSRIAEVAVMKRYRDELDNEHLK